MIISSSLGVSAKEKAFPIIKKWESLKTVLANGNIQAYSDPTGTPTIGWGSISYETVPAIRSRFGRDAVRLGDVITRQEADQLLYAEVDEKYNGIISFFTRQPNANQLAAFISLAYNAGAGFVKDSQVLAMFNRSDDAGAAERWKKTAITSKGIVLNGLINRRADESKLYATPAGLAGIGSVILGGDDPKKKRLIIVAVALLVLAAIAYYSLK